MFTQYYRSTIRSSNLTGTCNNLELKPQPILNVVVRPGIIRFRKGLSLFIDTLIGTLVGRRRDSPKTPPWQHQQRQWNWDSRTVAAQRSDNSCRLVAQQTAVGTIFSLTTLTMLQIKARQHRITLIAGNHSVINTQSWGNRNHGSWITQPHIFSSYIFYSLFYTV